MPLYEFRCEKCGEEFEELVRSAQQEAELRCPACGAARPARRPSVFAAHAAAAPLPRAGGCGRCGDPDGPCGLDE